MPAPDGDSLAIRRQTLERILSDRLQHSEPGLPGHCIERTHQADMDAAEGCGDRRAQQHEERKRTERQRHPRARQMRTGEIFGHEFWSHDGKTIWYDLQTPRGEDFWLAGYNVETGERTRYHLPDTRDCTPSQIRTSSDARSAGWSIEIAR